MYKILLGIAISTSLFSDTISFDDALNQTLLNNKKIKAKKLSIEDAKLNLKNANSYDYGTLKFNENIAKTNGALNVFAMKLMSREASFGDFGFSEFDNTNSNILNVKPNDLNNPDSRSNFETKLTYELPIFTGYKLENAKSMAKLQVKANMAKFSYDKKQLGLEVLKAYNGAVAAKYFINATKKAKVATLSFVNFATEMKKEGYITIIDVKQALVYDLKIDSLLLESKNKFSLAIEYLKFLTTNNNISDVAGFVTINTSNVNLDVNQRDDYKWMKSNTNTMYKKINFEKSANYPTIGAHIEYGFNDNQLNNVSSKKDYYVAAIGLEYKIFDGFKNENDIQKARLAYKKTKNYLDYMKDGINLQVIKAKLNLNTKKAILKQKLKSLDLENEVLEQSNEMYKNQLIKMSDLLMQQAKQQEAEALVIKSRYDLSIASANLNLAVGHNIKGEK